MEISFRKIELEDRELLQGYLSQKTYRSCDLVFANIYLWSRKYHTEFAIVEKTLIFCGFQEDGAPSITFPIGEQGQIKKALDQMFAWFEAQNAEIHMYVVQKKEFELLEAWYPQKFEISYNRDFADYVYETEKLTSLAGKNSIASATISIVSKKAIRTGCMSRLLRKTWRTVFRWRSVGVSKCSVSRMWRNGMRCALH